MQTENKIEFVSCFRCKHLDHEDWGELRALPTMCKENPKTEICCGYFEPRTNENLK